MEKFLSILKTIFFGFMNFLKMLVLLIVIAFSLIFFVQWSDEQSKVSNQYDSEDVSEDLLYDVKMKMSEQYDIPIDMIRIVRNEKSFGLGYEYFVIKVDEDDQEIESYEIDDYEIQAEIDDAIDGSENGISEEELQEKYNIGDDVE